MKSDKSYILCFEKIVAGKVYNEFKKIIKQNGYYIHEF